VAKDVANLIRKMRPREPDWGAARGSWRASQIRSTLARRRHQVNGPRRRPAVEELGEVRNNQEEHGFRRLLHCRPTIRGSDPVRVLFSTKTAVASTFRRHLSPGRRMRPLSKTREAFSVGPAHHAIPACRQPNLRPRDFVPK